MRVPAVAVLGVGSTVVVTAEFLVIGLVPAMSAELGILPGDVGWLLTLFALSSALLGPVLVVATRGYRPTYILAAALLPFAASLLLLFSPSFSVAAVLRVLQGATLPLFMSLAGGQLARSQGTGRGIALLYVGVTIGATLAPSLGAFLSARLGWAAAMASTGAFALVAATTCLKLPFRKSSDDQASSWRLLRGSSLQAHLLLSALLFAAMFTGFSYIALLLGNAGLDADAIAVALLGFGAVGLLGNWLAGAISRQALSATSGVAVAVAGAAAWLALAGDVDAVVLGFPILIWGMAHAAGFVICQVRVMAAAPDAPAFAGSLNISAANLGIALGSLAGGCAIEKGGTVMLAGMTSAFALMAVCLAVRIGRSRPDREASVDHSGVSSGVT